MIKFSVGRTGAVGKLVEPILCIQSSSLLNPSHSITSVVSMLRRFNLLMSELIEVAFTHIDSICFTVSFAVWWLKTMQWAFRTDVKLTFYCAVNSSTPLFPVKVGATGAKVEWLIHFNLLERVSSKIHSLPTGGLSSACHLSPGSWWCRLNLNWDRWKDR